MNRYLVVIRTALRYSGSAISLTSQIIDSDKSIEVLSKEIQLENCSVLLVQL